MRGLAAGWPQPWKCVTHICGIVSQLESVRAFSDLASGFSSSRGRHTSRPLSLRSVDSGLGASSSRALQQQHLTPPLQPGFGWYRTRVVAMTRTDQQTLGVKNPTSARPNIVIGNADELEKKKRAIRNAGMSSLQVIADFDMTLTKYMVDGRRGQSTHALLSQGNAEYDLKRQELFEIYYPMEISPDIPLDEKTKLMETWWGKSHGLLIEGGLNHENIKRSVENGIISFRDGTAELFEILDMEGIPLLIFSAGLADIIEEILRQRLHRSFSNIRVVSNRMSFDSNGSLTGFVGKTIHVLNKNEHALEMAAPLHDEEGNPLSVNDVGASCVRGRKNVLLLGDHLGDLGMSDGVDYDNRISVGFLNENAEKWLDTYKRAFDIVVLSDGSLDCVVDLVQELRS